MKRWLNLGLCLAALSAYAAPGSGPEALSGGDYAAAEQLYMQLKQDGGEIPTWLNDMINPPSQGNGQRTGGETQGTATEIPFVAGGAYTDAGTTVGSVNDFDTALAATYCQVGSNLSSAFAAGELYYTFTLPGQYAVSVDICGASYDSVLGIINSSGTLVGMNDDGGGCATSSRSMIPSCCLPADTYYIVVDGYSTNTGTYTLNVSFSADVCVMPCDTYAANITALSAPGTATGTTVGMPNVYAGASGDQGINISIPYAGEWNFDTCVIGTGYAADIYLFTASPCTGGTLIASNTSATCAVFTGSARLLNVGLQAGTYHLLVGNSSTAEGAFAMSVFETTPSRPTAGGPDAFGYVWRNSLDPTGPAFDWVEISGVGTPITLSSGSSYAGPFPLGMNFPFYESTFAQFYVSSEGFLSFNALTSNYSTNATIPAVALPQNIVAGFWDDLSFTTGVGQAYYYWDAANSRFILEFKNFTKTSVLTTFEIILYQNGNMVVQYLDMPEIYLNSATLGIEDGAGVRGVLVNYNNTGGALFDGIATRFTRPVGDVVGPAVNHTPLGNTEMTGPYTVNADISDLDNAVASATLFYQVNGGGYTSVAMTAGTPPAYSAEIPAQSPSSTVAYYIQAVDTAVPSNTTTTSTWSFRVQDYSLPPSGLTASDGVLDVVNLSWTAPAWLDVAAAGPAPTFEDFLPLHASKDAAWQAYQTAYNGWLAAQTPADRAFLNYNIYRDGGLIGTSATLTFADIPPSLSVYTYHVTALFNAGESAISNTDTGFMTARPTSGGPDGLGYTWVNSLDAGGPTFTWVDISTNPNAVAVTPLGDDTFVAGIPMGITFPFYIANQTTVNVAMNGFINFGAGSGSLSNQLFPNTSVPNNTIALFWDDLDPGDGVGAINYLSDPANNRFIVQYTTVPDFPGPGGPPNTFQAILSTNGDILVQLLDIQGDKTSATIGIENADGSVGLAANYNNVGGRIANNMAYLFIAPEGDWVGPAIAHTPLTDTEFDGPYAVNADVTDEDSNVASATLYYRVNAGAYTPVAMTAGTPPAYSASIPDQTPPATVDYYIVAVDDSPNANSTTSATWSFDVVDWTWAPQNFTASDGLLGEVQLAWTAPAPAPAAVVPPVVLPTMEELVARGMTKDAAWAWLQAITPVQDAGRSFQTYHVYRNGGLIGTTTSLSYVDVPPQVVTVYTYHVTALFDAGESNPSNSDTGFMTARPTSGGPDAFGYRWMNSDDPSGNVTFAWTDISSDPNAVSHTLTDDSSALVPLGFQFPFYGVNQDTIFVGSNGLLGVNASATTYTNASLPLVDTPNHIICPFWDDLNPSLGGTVHSLVDIVNGRFTAQWTGILHYGTTTLPYTFQVVLQSDGQVLVNYLDMQGARNSATVGIENALGTDGLLVNFDDAGGRIGNNLRVRIYPVLPCPTPANVNVTIVAPGNANITWDAVAEATSYNVYVATNGYDAYTLLGTSAGTSYTHVGAQALGKRFYKVAAVCD